MTPDTTKLVAAALQSGIGAASALLAVFLTQRHAAKSRRDSLFDRLFDQHFVCYSEIHSALLDLRQSILAKRDTTKSKDALIQALKTHSLFLDESVIAAAQAILEKNNAGHEVDAEICNLVEQLRELAGVTELRETIRKGKKK